MENKQIIDVENVSPKAIMADCIEFCFCFFIKKCKFDGCFYVVKRCRSDRWIHDKHYISA